MTAKRNAIGPIARGVDSFLQLKGSQKITNEINTQERMWQDMAHELYLMTFR